MIRSQFSCTRPGRLRLDVAEHVRVAADELLVDQPRRRLEVALAALLEQQREEVDLEEQVAELVEQLRVVVRERRVGDLVGLLDGVRDDRPRGLLAVPRAVAAQALGQLLQLEQGLARGPPRQPVVDVVVVVAAVAVVVGRRVARLRSSTFFS